jgi:hypothetical protein
MNNMNNTVSWVCVEQDEEQLKYADEEIRNLNNFSSFKVPKKTT